MDGHRALRNLQQADRELELTKFLGYRHSRATMDDVHQAGPVDAELVKDTFNPKGT